MVVLENLYLERTKEGSDSYSERVFEEPGEPHQQPRTPDTS